MSFLLAGCVGTNTKTTVETHFEPCITILPEINCPPVDSGFDPDGHSVKMLIEAYGDARKGHQVCAQDVNTLKRTLNRCIENND